MTLALNPRIAETGFDAGAAAAFAAALAFATSALAGLNPMIAGLVTFPVTFFALQRVQREDQCFDLPAFEAEGLGSGSDELLLTDDMALRQTEPGGDELLLNDVLARLEPDSRVVRLFDPRQLLTPGELQANIDRHLQSPRPAASAPDASQALSDALAQLRRSLR